MEKRFTDNQLGQLYQSLSRDYKKLSLERLNPMEIYQRLLSKVHFSLTDPKSSLFGLPPHEQQKIYTVLNAFFSACPNYRAMSLDQQTNLLIFHYVSRDSHWDNCCYCPSDNFFFNWLLIERIFHNGNSTSTNNTHGEDLLWLFITALAIIQLILALIALYYLLNACLDSIERFYFDEGWLQATVTMASIAVGGAAPAVLTSIFLSSPLTAFFLSAGLANPLGMVIFCIVCLSIIGAGLGCFVTNKIQDYIIKKTNTDALDPRDPHRFSLTEKEEQNIIRKGLDPLKIKLVIATIREQMHVQEATQEQLDMIRRLRRAELAEDEFIVEVGEQAYDLRPFPPPMYMAPPPPPYSGTNTNYSFFPEPPPPYSGLDSERAPISGIYSVD